MPTEITAYSTDGVVEPPALDTARTDSRTTWVHLTDPTDEELEHVEELFGIHRLVTDDVVTNVRAKTEEFPSYTFALVKDVRLARGETTFAEEVDVTPVGLFIGDGWLVSIATEALKSIQDVQQALHRKNQTLLSAGSDFLASRIVDEVTEDYFLLLDRIEDQIEMVEDSVMVGPDPEVLEVVNNVRRELLAVRKQLIPARETVAFLARGDATYIHPETEKYFRNTYEQLVQLVELVETYRELARGARDIYLNLLSTSTNEVMKRLTAVATIILPLTFVTSLYGMNFTGSPYNMPELTWTFGYPAALVVMLLIGVVLGGYFRRAGWI